MVYCKQRKQSTTEYTNFFEFQARTYIITDATMHRGLSAGLFVFGKYKQKEKDRVTGSRSNTTKEYRAADRFYIA